MAITKPSLLFTLDDAQRAADEWGANCGPAAIAAISGLSLDAVRPHLGDFETKHYTNPTLMWAALRSLGVRWTCKTRLARDAAGAQYGDVGTVPLPEYGLARIQWEGPWTEPGVPIRVRYRHTHWVGCASDPGFPLTPGSEGPLLFDINAMCVGGWITFVEWSRSLVPWLLEQVEPTANGRWHITHSVEIARETN